MTDIPCPTCGGETVYQSFSGGQEWYCKTCDMTGPYPDAVMALVQPALDAKDAENLRYTEARLNDSHRELKRWVVELTQRAERAEADRDRLATDLGEMQEIATERAEACDQAEAAIERVRQALMAALSAWEGEHEFHQERAERKGYSHDEAAAEAYGTAIKAVTDILTALGQPGDQPKDTPACWLCEGLRGIAVHHHWTAQRGKPLWTAHTPASTQHLVHPCPACRLDDIVTQTRAKAIAEIRAQAAVYRAAEESQTTLGAKWDATQTAMLWDSIADFVERGEGEAP